MDPQLIDILVRAVDEEWARSGRPLPATQLGNVLGDAFRERGMQTGVGAFRPLMMLAVKTGRVEQLRDGSRIGLKPVESVGPTTSPTGDSEHQPGAAAPLGLPDEAAPLLPDVYETFTGRKSPAWVDLDHPPRLTFVDATMSGYVSVSPVAAHMVRDAWEKFATDHSLSTEQRSIVAARLSSEEPRTLWGRVDIPGDTYASRFGTRFWRVRMLVLAHGIREWFVAQGKDVAHYQLLARPPARMTREPPGRTPTPGPTETKRSGTPSREVRLRSRLHRVIDAMSLEQLCEQRIPAEYFDESS